VSREPSRSRGAQPVRQRRGEFSGSIGTDALLDRDLNVGQFGLPPAIARSVDEVLAATPAGVL
jgi:hypothetical protein